MSFKTPAVVRIFCTDGSYFEIFPDNLVCRHEKSGNMGMDVVHLNGVDRDQIVHYKSTPKHRLHQCPGVISQLNVNIPATKKPYYESGLEDDVPPVPKGCTCGAKHTKNPNLHATWCDLRNGK